MLAINVHIHTFSYRVNSRADRGDNWYAKVTSAGSAITFIVSLTATRFGVGERHSAMDYFLVTILFGRWFVIIDNQRLSLLVK